MQQHKSAPDPIFSPFLSFTIGTRLKATAVLCTAEKEKNTLLDGRDGRERKRRRMVPFSLRLVDAFERERKRRENRSDKEKRERGFFCLAQEKRKAGKYP